MKFAKVWMALCLPLLLAGCLLAPGRFTSSLDIRADRGFTFAYQGEVVAFDPGGDISAGMKGMATGMAGAMASGAVSADEG